MMRLKRIIYPTFGMIFSLVVMGGHAVAFDLKDGAEHPSRSPFEVFKSGLSAYKSGHTDEALKALRYAADQGHPGANWKLARMYADGDGVPEDDFEAYQIFEKIVHDGVDQGSQNEAYVADALVALAGYLKRGIPGTRVRENAGMARDLYVQAASNFGDSVAQFELGKMLFLGEGGEKNPVQAARWFQLAANKGNASAQAMLGNMLFQAGKTVRGLAMLTAAFERSTQQDRDWIRDLQEHAFSLSGEADRRTAISLADDIISKNR